MGCDFAMFPPGREIAGALSDVVSRKRKIGGGEENDIEKAQKQDIRPLPLKCFVQRSRQVVHLRNGLLRRIEAGSVVVFPPMARTARRAVPFMAHVIVELGLDLALEAPAVLPEVLDLQGPRP